jgi:predicted transcriptional regulator
MLVDELLPAARDRLSTIGDDAPLIEAARRLRSGVDILVVCSPAGLMRGVITKTDVVAQIGQCQGSACRSAASNSMARNVVSCRSGDSLEDLWNRMNERGLKNVPFVDQDFRPLGVLNARDMLQALLKESSWEESMMRDYVMGVGYR